MKFNIFIFLVITIFVDIGLSKPLNHLRKKRQLGGTGTAGGINKQDEILLALTV